MNAIDRLRKMLDEANIPYESYCTTHKDMEKKYADWGMPDEECEADKYFRNQIVIGRNMSTIASWLFDAIYQYGSYGRHADMLETYGEFGSDESGDPDIMTAQEAFDVIKSLYDNKQF